MVKGWWDGGLVLVLMVGDVYLGIGMGCSTVVLALYGGGWVWWGLVSCLSIASLFM